MKFIITLISLIFAVSASAQSLKGRVTDVNGQPIAGAIVRTDDTHGAATDYDGRYTIERLQQGATEVTASFMGYLSQTRKISGTEQNFILQEAAVDMEQVVCTGTRTPKLLKDAPIATRVITAEEIRTADASDLGEFLQTELPGAEVSYAMSQNSQINFQGFGGNAVLFLVDGERMAGETLDNVDYSRLNMDDVARIEIVKGASSSLYGSNAVGGVINIISRQATAPFTLNVNGRWSKYSQQRYGASLGICRGIVSSQTNFSYTSSDSIHMPNPGDFTKIYGSTSWTVKERLTVRPSDDLTLTGRASYFYRERESSDAATDRYRDVAAGIKANYTFSDSDDAELAFSFDEYDKSDYNKASHNDIRDYRNCQHTLRGLYNHTFSELTNGLSSTLTVGADAMRDYLMTYQFNGGSKKQISADVFGQLDWNLTKKWGLILGVRYDYFSAAKQSQVTAKVSSMYRGRGQMNYRLSYAGGFRAPSLKEMYMEYDMASIFTIYGNEDLEAEKSHNFMLSAEKVSNNISATASVFYNIVDNRITTAWNQSLGGMKYVNMARLQICGGEANFIGKWACGIGAQIGYTYTHEHIKSGEPLTSDTRPHTLNARLSYAKDWNNYGFKFTISTRFMSKLTTDEYTSYTDYTLTAEQTYPGYSITRLALTQRIWHGIRVNAGIDNLFDYTPSYYYNRSPFTTGLTVNGGISIDVDQLFR